MYRQSPGRNPRSKGIKVKNVLQICLLLAICFWLLYQVKHSHDKKKEFDESDTKASSSDELIRLGRKDIRTRVGETLNKDEINDEPSDEEEINGEEVDENKHEEDEVEDKKVDVKEEEEDETDEHEQEKSDAEVDREVDVEEKENGDENETQNTDSEDGHGQIDKESSAEETDHDGDGSSTHEAREEHYKADDASSAVTHDHPENILEVENKENEETYKSENRKELQVGGGEVAGDGHNSDVTTTETVEDLIDNSANGSFPNNTVADGSNDHLEDRGLPSENVTETKPEPGLAQGIVTESVSAGGSDLHTVDSERANISIVNVNSTVSDAKEFPNSSNNSASENALISETFVEAGNNTEILLENNNEIEGEKSDTSDGTDENLETTENSEEVQQDAIDISDTSNLMHEKDVRTDLETLPEIQTEGADSEDAAE